MAVQTVVLAALTACSAVLGAKLPAEFPRCHMNDVDSHSCLAASIETALQSLKDGQQSLGLPSIAPLLIKEMSLDLGSGPIPLVIHGKDIIIKGLEKSSVTEAKLDRETNVLTMTTHTQTGRLDFNYTATGKILLVAVQGEGPAFFEFGEMFIYHKLHGEPFEKKGKTYWNITDYNVDTKVEKMTCHFDNLLKGNPQVSEQVNAFLNDDWRLFFEQIRGPARQAFGLIFQQMANRVFTRVPISDIFLDL